MLDAAGALPSPWGVVVSESYGEKLSCPVSSQCHERQG